MRYPCNVIKDLLPMYYDKICSDASKAEIEMHLSQCQNCTQYYNNMCQSGGATITYPDNHMEQKRLQAVKKAKKKMRKETSKLVGGIIGIYLLIQLLPFCLVFGLAGLDWFLSKVEVNTDITQYEQYMIGDDSKEAYRNKWGMDETIFPDKITDDMNVKDYKMVYYNPFDAQYLGYLVVEYDEVDYKTEVQRLKEYESTDYLGNYGVTGFNEDYTLLAMYADDYQGFVYALTDNKDTIVYVELIFCNYFYDLKYEEYMPAEYFPEGFDATKDNAYRKKMMGE